MRIRREPTLVALLAVLSVGAVTSSVLIGLNGLSASSSSGPVARLPDILFSREPGSARVAPVKVEITQEIESPVPSPQSEPSPAGTSTPAAGKPRPASSASLPPAISSPAKSMSADLSAELFDNPRRIVYTASIQNTGNVALSAVKFTSHVPKQTTWQERDPNCASDQLPVRVTFPGTATSIYCVPGGVVAGSDDPRRHPVEITLSRAIDPGEAVTISFTLSVNNGAKDLTNHGHAAGDGLTADTPTVETRVR